MDNLNKYVEEMKEEVLIRNLTTELEIIKFVYFDLGNRFSFDPKFIPFGDSRYRQNFYRYHAGNIYDLNECMENGIIICKSVSHILEYVLSKFDIDIKIYEDVSEKRKHCPHVCNQVTLKDGRKFIIDLQEDIRNIKLNFFTSNFGVKSLYGTDYVISKDEQRKVDVKLGYISNNNDYTDEYISVLESLVSGVDDIFLKLDIILNNIDIITPTNLCYTDRLWYHKDILEKFFTYFEFNYSAVSQSGSGKIKIINCHLNVDQDKIYVCLIQVFDKGKAVYYMYDDVNYKYNKISLEELADYYQYGLIVHNSRIHGLRKELKARRNEEKNN